MRRLLAAGLLALAGCGGGGGTPLTGEAKAVHDTCVANGGAVTYCDCTTRELQGKLTPEVFTAVSKGEMGSDPATTLDVMAAADKACKKP